MNWGDNLPDYKKKKVRKVGYRAAPKKKVQKPREEKIKMQPQRKPDNQPKEAPKVRVVTGAKLIRREKTKRFILVALAVCMIITGLHFLMPVSIMESVGNSIKAIGSGSYPIVLEGTSTLNTVQCGGYYYTLTDTQLKAVSNSGKQIYSVTHGFAAPVLKTAPTRAMIFDQDGNLAEIYNLSKRVGEIETEKNIVTADISRNGTYAIVTEADNYAAVVSVYDKRNKLVYEWYSASELVNNVVIADNGKKIAVSTIDAVDGHISSKLYVLNFEGPDAVYTADYGEGLVYSLQNSSNGFIVGYSNGVDFITWSRNKKTSFSSDKQVAFIDTTPSGTVVALNLESNKSDNTIVVLGSRGRKLCEFQFDGIISDIVLSHGHIYCMSNTNLYKYNKKGEQVATASCNFTGSAIEIISSNEAAVVSNSDITRVKFTSKG